MAGEVVRADEVGIDIAFSGGLGERGGGAGDLVAAAVVEADGECQSGAVAGAAFFAPEGVGEVLGKSVRAAGPSLAHVEVTERVIAEFVLNRLEDRRDLLRAVPDRAARKIDPAGQLIRSLTVERR